MTLSRKTALASSVLTLLIGCGNSGASTNNQSSGAGAATGSGGASGGTSSGASGTGAMTMTTGGSSGAGAVGAGGTPANGGAGSSAGGAAPMAGAGGAQASAGTSGNGAGGANGGASPMAGAGGASSGTSGSGGSGTTGGLTLTIDTNPNSVLSCYVSWKTDAPANSVVQFGVGTLQWEISDDTMVTDHKVLVIGMRASQTYAIHAISGSASGDGMFMTQALPNGVVAGTVMINDATKRQAGWTLINLEQGGTDNRPRSALPPMAVIYDEEGQPVWYYIDAGGPDIGGAVATQLTSTGVVIGPTWNANSTNGIPPREVDFGGNVIWECKHAACLPGKNVTHETRKLSNGHYMVIEYVNASAGQNPVYRELDKDSNEVWTLDWNALLPAPSGSSGDWCHGNAIRVDIEKNEAYANCRWVGLMKVTHDNPPKYQWLIPAKYGSKGQGDFTYMPATSQYSDSHDPEYHDDDDTVIFYDNGGWSGSVDTVAGTYHSRAVEYKIDTTAKTATLEWEFPGSFQTPDDWYTTKWYSPFWGHAGRLDNGNILIAGGMIGPTHPESRVFEVTKADGKVVWELRLPTNYGVYRANRVVPPLVHALTTK